MPVLRMVLLLVGLALGSLLTPWPWAALWWAVPVVVATSLLLAWRYGAVAWTLIGVLLGVAALAVLLPDTGLRLWHVMWLPLAAITGTWMGSREEGGGPSRGERAWMHVPLLVGAFLLPVVPGLHDALVRFEARARAEERQVLDLTQRSASSEGLQKHIQEALRYMIQESTKVPAADRVKTRVLMLPHLAFLGLVLLVAAGRSLAGRIAEMRGWPRLSSAAWSGWRLPDAALVPLLVGIALWLLTYGRTGLAATWYPGAVFLLVQALLGYSVQGIAVGRTLLSAHNARPFTMFMILLVLIITMPVCLITLALIGLSDVWLDHRRLEPSPRGEA